MRWLSQYQGALTQSRLDRAVVARYYAFLVISQLVIFTLIGVMFSMLSYRLYQYDIYLTKHYQRLRERDCFSDRTAQKHPRNSEQS